jgi:transcriptional regulator of acetoin/glycerol metabolism
VSVLRTASAMLDPDERCIDWRHLPDDMGEELAATQKPARPAPIREATQNLRALSSAAIQQALEGTRGNISEAARRLGISRQTLYRKMDGGQVG